MRQRCEIEFSLFCACEIRESLKAQIRMEAFNLLNHPNIGSPDNSVRNPNFGLISTINAGC